MSATDANIETLSYLGHLITRMETDEMTRDILRQSLTQRIDELKAKAAEGKTKAEYKRFQDALSKSLPAIANDITRAVKAFQSGDDYAGISAVVSIAATLSSTIGGMLGPAGGLAGGIISALLQIFASFLGGLSKPPKSIEQRLNEVIRLHDSQNKIQQLNAVRSELIANAEYLMNSSQRNSSAELITMLAIESKYDRILVAGEWLLEKDNQNLTLWPAVLAAQCQAFGSLISLLHLAMAKRAKTNGDVQDLMNYTESRNKPQLNFLKAVQQVARNRGTLFIMQRTPEGPRDHILTRDVVVGDAAWEELPGDWSQLSMTVAARQMGQHRSGQPPYHALFTLEHQQYFMPVRDWDHTAESIRVHPFRKALNTKNASVRFSARFGQSPMDRRIKHQTFQVPGGNGLNFRDCYDIWAVTGYRQGEVFLMTANGVSLTVWAQGDTTHNDHDDIQPIRLQANYPMPTGYKLGMVRAVYPRLFADQDISKMIDPSVEMLCAIYGACEVGPGSSQITGIGAAGGTQHMELYVSHLQRPLTPPGAFRGGFFKAPWNDFVGLAADSKYLWVYRSDAIACATHFDVMMGVVNQQVSPQWMVYEIPHDVTDPAYDPGELINYRGNFFRQGLMDLAACDDGSLVAIYGNKGQILLGDVYLLSPTVDRQRQTLTMAGSVADGQGHDKPTHGWKRTAEKYAIQPYRVLKEPIYCWSVIDGLYESLTVEIKPQQLNFSKPQEELSLTIKNHGDDSMSLKVLKSGTDESNYEILQHSQTIEPGGSGLIQVKKIADSNEPGESTLWIICNGQLRSVKLT